MFHNVYPDISFSRAQEAGTLILTILGWRFGRSSKNRKCEAALHEYSRGLIYPSSDVPIFSLSFKFGWQIKGGRERGTVSAEWMAKTKETEWRYSYHLTEDPK